MSYLRLNAAQQYRLMYSIVISKIGEEAGTLRVVLIDAPSSEFFVTPRGEPHRIFATDCALAAPLVEQHQQDNYR